MLRPETRARARALQILYATEATGRTPEQLIPGLTRLTGPEPTVLGLAEQLATEVHRDQMALDELLAAATENWRLERLSVIDRNILRIGSHELSTGRVPPRVAIDEALWLAHRFGSSASPAFVNGVLDRVARNLGRL